MGNIGMIYQVFTEKEVHTGLALRFGNLFESAYLTENGQLVRVDRWSLSPGAKPYVMKKANYSKAYTKSSNLTLRVRNKTTINGQVEGKHYYFHCNHLPVHLALHPAPPTKATNYFHFTFDSKDTKDAFKNATSKKPCLEPLLRLNDKKDRFLWRAGVLSAIETDWLGALGDKWQGQALLHLHDFMDDFLEIINDMYTCKLKQLHIHSVPTHSVPTHSSPITFLEEKHDSPDFFKTLKTERYFVVVKETRHEYADYDSEDCCWDVL